MSDENQENSAAIEETDFEAAFKEHAEAKEHPPEVGSEDDELGTVENDGAITGEKITPPQNSDPYAGMSEAVKEKVIAMEQANEELTHRIDSDAGRVSALQRKINGLEKEQQDIRNGTTTGVKANPNQIAEAMSGSDSDWETFSADYPEVAKSIDSRLDQAGKATQQSIEDTLAPVREKQALDDEKMVREALAEAAKPVTEIYPEWIDAVKTDEFVTWLGAQSPGVRSLSDSADANDASLLIGLYDTHLVATGKPTLKADAPESGGTEEVSKLAEKRKQQLEAGTTIKSKGARMDPSSDPVDEFEAAFNYHAKRRERQSA